MLCYNEFMVKEQVVVSWEAKEYVTQDKNGGWYVGLGLVGLGLVVLSVLLQWWTFTALVVISVLALVVYSVRPPRVLKYELTETGLKENGKIYQYSDFKSFGIQKENTNFSIVLVPRKRFAMRVTVYFPEKQGEKIVDSFGQKLPMEEVKMDYLDRLVKFLRI